MRQKISISVDEDKMIKIEELLKGSRFRSKSHIMEYSLNKYLKESKDE